jgi:hypothetical protein
MYSFLTAPLCVCLCGRQVLCQDAPILRHFYPTLSRFTCPLFSETEWLTHEVSAFQTWTHYKQTSTVSVGTTTRGCMTTCTKQESAPQHRIMLEDALAAVARDSVRAVLPSMVPEFLQRARFASVPAGFSMSPRASFTVSLSVSLCVSLSLSLSLSLSFSLRERRVV